jgi:Leucine-rich repeat (LRR) protein
MMNRQEQDAKDKEKAARSRIVLAAASYKNDGDDDGAAPPSKPGSKSISGKSSGVETSKASAVNRKPGAVGGGSGPISNRTPATNSRAAARSARQARSNQAAEDDDSDSEPDVEMMPGAIASGPGGEAQLLRKARLSSVTTPVADDSPSLVGAPPVAQGDHPPPQEQIDTQNAPVVDNQATILDSVMQRMTMDSANTPNKYNNHSDQQDVVDGNEIENQTEEEEDDSKLPFCTKSKLIIAIGLLVVVIILAVAIPLATSSSGDSSTVDNGSDDASPTISPTLRPTASVPTAAPSMEPTSVAFSSLVNTISSVIPYDDSIFSTSQSPQYRAIQWVEADGLHDQLNYSDDQILQRYILVVMYYATIGEEWVENIRFLRPTDVCEWQDDGVGTSFDGVRCNEAGQVTELIVPELNLQGTLPSELGFLTHLSILRLNGNQDLAGTIPTTLGQLTQLELLQLRLLDLEGTLPTELSNIPTLRQLDVEDCGLEGSIPELAPTLTVLNLQRNNFVDDLDESYCLRNSLDVRSDCGGVDPEVACSCCSFCCDENDVCDFNS